MIIRELLVVIYLVVLSADAPVQVEPSDLLTIGPRFVELGHVEPFLMGVVLLVDEDVLPALLGIQSEWPDDPVFEPLGDGRTVDFLAQSDRRAVEALGGLEAVFAVLLEVVGQESVGVYLGVLGVVAADGGGLVLDPLHLLDLGPALDPGEGLHLPLLGLLALLFLLFLPQGLFVVLLQLLHVELVRLFLLYLLLLFVVELLYVYGLSLVVQDFFPLLEYYVFLGGESAGLAEHAHAGSVVYVGD